MILQDDDQKSTKMKANELMIGAWVQGFLPDTYCKIYGIFNEYKVAVYGNGVYMELPIEDLQPIPITDEILEKNGFTENKADGWKKEWGLTPANFGRRHYITDINCINGGFDFGFYREGKFIDLVHIKYIHQLQQAVRICGIDKEIEL